MSQKSRYYVPADRALQHHLWSMLAEKSNLTLTKLLDSTTSLYEIQGQDEPVKGTLGMQHTKPSIAAHSIGQRNPFLQWINYKEKQRDKQPTDFCFHCLEWFTPLWESSHLQAKKRTLTRTWSCCTLISNFQFPELWEKNLLLRKLFILWYFVMGA